MSAPILLSVDDGLATLTLNRPERLNAFNADMARAWERVTIEVTGRGDVGAIVLAGAGSSFCAGGERRALQLVLTDRLLSAREALEWGLVAEVVDDDAVLARVEEVARSWLDGATRAYGQAKRLIRSSPSRSVADQLEVEARTIGESFDTDDDKQRIAAFVEASRRRAQTRG